MHINEVSQIAVLQRLICMHAALALNVALQKAPPLSIVSNIVLIQLQSSVILQWAKKAVRLTKSFLQTSRNWHMYSRALCSSYPTSMTCRQRAVRETCLLQVRSCCSGKRASCLKQASKEGLR